MYIYVIRWAVEKIVFDLALLGYKEWFITVLKHLILG
jgi:hypothetical protein